MELIKEETAKRVEEAIRKKVEESLNSEEIKLELQRRLEEGRRKLLDVVAVQLEKEKESAVIEARKREASIHYKLKKSLYRSLSFPYFKLVKVFSSYSYLLFFLVA